jgi:hypothetical protein
MRISQVELVGLHGTFHLNNTSAKTMDFVGFRVDKDAVISALNDGANVLSAYIAAPATALPAGTIVKHDFSVFKSITLSSGSVTLIKP